MIVSLGVTLWVSNNTLDLIVACVAPAQGLSTGMLEMLSFYLLYGMSATILQISGRTGDTSKTMFQMVKFYFAHTIYLAMFPQNKNSEDWGKA